MKIKIQYENKITYLEVPDQDCTVMIDADYQDRLLTAEDKDAIVRRPMQEIMDERFNRPDYNNWHTFDRHRGEPKKKLRKDDENEDITDTMDTLGENTDEDDRNRRLEYNDICDRLRSSLKPKQAELLIAIYLDEVPVTEYARLKGVTVSAISHQLETAKKNFKKIFPESSTFRSSRG